jgi:hypothetical protein
MVSLLESLGERFPPQEIHEFGKCLIIPIREFPDAYGERLKSQGYKIRYQGFGGRSCAFVLLNRGNGGNGEGQKADPQVEAPAPSGQKESELKRDSKQDDVPKQPGQPTREGPSNGKSSGRGRAWTDQEVSSLKEFYGLGLSVLKIAQKLDRSKIAVESKCQQLGLRRVDAEVKLKRQPGPGLDAKASTGELEPESEKRARHNGDLVKELLEASSVLYPQYRHAAALVLDAAAKEMEGGEA